MQVLEEQAQCSAHCHSTEFDCGNLSWLEARAEVALVARHGGKQLHNLPAPEVLGGDASELARLDEQDDPPVPPACQSKSIVRRKCRAGWRSSRLAEQTEAQARLVEETEV